MPISASLKQELIDTLPSLRAFSISLIGDVERADDLVQTALLKGWSNIDSFTEGTNLRAWLFTILRNEFYSEMRKKGREVEDVDDVMTSRLADSPRQDAHLELQDFRAALSTLPAAQREALVLVGASGLSYEEAAQICGCAIGTIKSRVNRARNNLVDLLNLDDEADFGRSEVDKAVLLVGGDITT